MSANKNGKKTKQGDSPQEPSYVGWGFWLIAFAVLAGPCVYAFYLIAYEDRRGTLLPWVLGGSAAALIAGVLSSLVNTLLDWKWRRTKSRGLK